MQTPSFLKTVKLIVVIIVLTSIALGAMAIYNAFIIPKSSVNLNRSSVVLQMQELSRLETASFTIEKIIEAGKDGNAFQDILYGDRILLIAHADVIAGIDFSKLASDEVMVSDNRLSITLPAAEILVSKLDNDLTRVYDRRTGIFASNDKDLESEARSKAEESIRKAACDAGILELAATNAKKQVRAIFQTAGFEEVEVNVKAGTCK